MADEQERNKRLMRQVYDILESGDADRADDLIAEDLIEHEELPGVPPGREGFKEFVRMWHAAFPDTRFTEEVVVAEGDLVAYRGTMTATHKGEFMGIPATGREVRVAVMDIGRWRDGKGVEHWGTTDMLSLLQQIGAIPEGAPA